MNQSSLVALESIMQPAVTALLRLFCSFAIERRKYRRVRATQRERRQQSCQFDRIRVEIGLLLP